MKKLLFILATISFTLTLNAQQTEDEIYIGKGKIFGNFSTAHTKTVDEQKLITGEVVGICKKDCCNKNFTTCTIQVKTNDGNIIWVSTAGKEFALPKKIVGQTIIIECRDASQVSNVRKRKDLKNDVQQDFQFNATGIKVL
jgi:hypothetical protein